jgi:hypothetical protein
LHTEGKVGIKPKFTQKLAYLLSGRPLGFPLTAANENSSRQGCFPTFLALYGVRF